jgi:hypothetical protein
VHDFKVFKNSKLPINANKLILVDAGYQGLQKHHLKCKLPIKRTKTKLLNDLEKQQNLQLSKKRVVVEHVIGKVKVFRIMSERYRNRRKKHTQRMKFICGIYNFEL